ncbi:MAG: tetratricopeptide repeat protein [Reyranella sp.]|uniref:O-linked N-acetylglucosamine transferase, SPINDLY family protein n=1 Tax=Reyranella sp. TaxID=1929291 RepID=UPI003D14F961
MTPIESADALFLAGDLDAAAGAYRRLVAADHRNQAAWRGLGAARLRARAFGEASDALDRAVHLQPNDGEAWMLRAEALFKLGDVEPAIGAYRRAAEDVTLRAAAEENIAIMIPGSALAGNAGVLAARRIFGRRLHAGVGPVERPPRPPSAGKLRIGYVSAFFDSANWMKPVYGVINRHDRERFEVHLVSLGGDPSEQAGYRDHDLDVIWQVGSLDDGRIAALLAAAGIDVLVDLNSYSAPRWLPLFLRRPAPVQIGWFNSFATYGFDCFDGIVGDDVVIPMAEEAYFAERVLRVRGTYLAFEVLYAVPDVAPPPCCRNDGTLTFGALTSSYKLNDTTLGVWARVLRSAPGARMLIRASTLSEPSNRDHLLARFAALGIARERLDIEGGATHFEFLRSYDRIDIALDMFPYSGGTTTSEALWQGVPVLTCAGDRWVARTSESLLRAAGLDAWVAADQEDLVAKASALARDPATHATLAVLRADMRARLAASAACDTAGLCRALEQIYRQAVG